MKPNSVHVQYFIVYLPITIFIPYIIQMLFHPGWAVIVLSIIFAIWVGLTLSSNSVKHDKIIALLLEQRNGGVK